MIENPMVVERPARSWGWVNLTPPKDDPVCVCGESVQVKEYRTHEHEWACSLECLVRIAFEEKWFVKEVV